MKGDFSRQTFQRDKHYSGVLMQQGRVQLDADWNEQHAIARYRTETQAADVVGAAGAPKERPGFAITPQGQDLRIGSGRFYVAGLLCENERDTPFSAQEDVLPLGGPPLPVAAGLYLTYLEVWERHITALEDGSVRESALGGPDTTTRSRTVWQVKLLRVTDPGGPVAGDTPFAEWDQLLASRPVDAPAAGRLAARAQAVVAPDDPACILPPTAGYRRLENQLYRVEVHRGGPRATARFKWSRDNGTVVSAIEPDENGNLTSGTSIVVAELGKDALLTFASDPLPQWLELTDDRYELGDQRGTLLRVEGVDPATRTITFAPGPLPALDPGRHPLVRRWDQRGGGVPAVEPDGEGVPMTGDWQPLEDGVEVRFTAGAYLPGDHWLVPARTAIGDDTGGVEWPLANGDPVPQTPDGVRHHVARLALVRSDGATFSAVADGDGRVVFPPLTGITASDVALDDGICQFGSANTVQEAIDVLCQRNGSLCNLLVGPGEDLASAFERLGPNPPGGRLDALICLRAGTYTVAAPLRVEGRGHIHLMGMGPGTRIVAPASESVLQFVDCTSVEVGNIHLAAGTVGRGTVGLDSLNGAITFQDCPAVTVRSVVATCAGGPLRAASCLTVRNAPTAIASRAVVSGCDLEVGHRQVGVLLVNVGRSRVTDNLVRAGARPPDAALLEDTDYRAAVRHQLFSGVVPGGGAAPPAGTNATVTYNDRQVHLRSDPGLIRGSRNDTEWGRAIFALAPAGITSPVLLERWLRDFAGRMVRTRGTGPGGSPLFATVIATVLAQDTATADQGIVVSGLVAREVTVTGNSLQDVVKGIHVGLGSGTTRGTAGVVTIRDNVVGVSLPTSASGDRFAVFVGNCDSLVVEGNAATLRRAQRNAGLRTEGIRIFGHLGRRVIVRHSHLMPGFTVGVTFAPLNSPVPAQPLWVVTENVMESAATKVDVPARAPGQPGPADPATVRGRILGLADNFA